MRKGGAFQWVPHCILTLVREKTQDKKKGMCENGAGIFT